MLCDVFDHKLLFIHCYEILRMCFGWTSVLDIIEEDQVTCGSFSKVNFMVTLQRVILMGQDMLNHGFISVTLQWFISLVSWIRYFHFLCSFLFLQIYEYKYPLFIFYDFVNSFNKVTKVLRITIQVEALIPVTVCLVHPHFISGS